MTGNKELFLWINQNWTPYVGQLARIPSFLGESAAMGILLLISLRMKVKASLLIALVWLSGAVHSWIFKLWLCKGWPRPYAYFSDKNITINLVDGVKIHHWNSFPSGHTITAFSILLLLPLLFPKTQKRYLMLCWGLAFSCGLSRIILAQHWPQDVLGGMLLGCSATWLANTVLSAFSVKFSIPARSLLSLTGIKKDSAG